jgi:hypothetical protein
VKAEHIVRGIPLGMFMLGRGSSNLILCIYADPCDECYCCAVAVLSALLVKRYLCVCIYIYIYILS